MTGRQPPGASHQPVSHQPVSHRFVETWASAIHRACFVPLSRAERCELLGGLAGRLAAALRPEPPEPPEPPESPDPAGCYRVGTEVGAALVAADYTAAEVLARTVTVLHAELLPELGLTGADAATAARLAALVEGVVAGFSRALRDRLLDNQEEIRLATTAARAEAERALRDREAQFRYAARHDRLTHLPNHAQLTDHLERLLADSPDGARLGLCSVDLDQFGSINDRLGSQAGDGLLVAVARRLGRLAGERGHLLARQHGDRFVIVVPDTTCLEDATKVADRALAGLTEPFQVDGHELAISASAGVVERPTAQTSPVELIRAADVALNWAKLDGRGRWTVFEEARNARDVARQRLSAALPGALRRDEFALTYQPLVDLRTGAVEGYEALARWHHPAYGELGADRFVPLAEDTGLVVPLGIRLLGQACGEASRWYAERGAAAPYVSVNVSARQLRQEGLVGEIVEALDRTGVPADKLQLEITESALVRTDDETVDRLAALAKLGIRVVIDDFGTGYSNFTYLYDLPVQGIKLAGQLLRSDRTGHAVLTALVSLGCTLGLTVTAEGVETAGQAQLLRVLGCHVGQGWHFGRPAPPDQVTGGRSGPACDRP